MTDEESIYLDESDLTEYASLEELEALQAAREEALAEHSDDDCEICNSEWYKNIDYRKLRLRVVTEEDRVEIRKMLGLEDSDPT